MQLFYFQREMNLILQSIPKLQNWYQSGFLYLNLNSSVLIISEEILYIFIDYKIYQRKCINQIEFLKYLTVKEWSPFNIKDCFLALGEIDIKIFFDLEHRYTGPTRFHLKFSYVSKIATFTLPAKIPVKG